MAVYLTSVLASAARPGRSAATSPQTELQSGATIFAGACASCHESASPLSWTHTVPLERTTSINAPDPRNALHIVLEGIVPEPGEKGPLMPAFEGALTDEQLVSLLAYLRVHFAHKATWDDVSRQARDIIQHTDETQR
jgi:mono/diheme cytochrome c family protein